MANINKELNQIKNAVYGKDVRQAIHDGIEKAYNDATSGGAGDTNLEVVLARGNYDSLNKRLDASDSQLADEAQQRENDISNLDAKKASKIELQNGLNSKVNRGENESVTWGMLDQDAKENISGDKVAVVGEDSVNTINIVDGAATYEKRTRLGEKVTVMQPANLSNLPNIDLNNKIITFYEDFFVVYGNKRQTIDATSISYEEVQSPGIVLYFGRDSGDIIAKSQTQLSEVDESYMFFGAIYFNRDRNVLLGAEFSFDYTINGKPSIEYYLTKDEDFISLNSNVDMPPIYPGTSGIYPDYDPVSRELKFNKLSFIVYGKKRITINENTTVSLDVPNASAVALYYDFADSVFVARDTRYADDVPRTSFLLAIAYRGSDNTRDKGLIINSNYTINGKPIYMPYKEDGDSDKPYEFSIENLEGEYSETDLPGVGDEASPFDYENDNHEIVYGLYNQIMEGNQENIKRIEWGRTDNDIPIYEYVSNPPRPSGLGVLKPYPKIIMGASIHGGEGLSVIALYYFFKRMHESWKQNKTLSYLRNNVIFSICPIRSPRDYDNKTYVNVNGVNINRNFPYRWEERDDDTKGTEPFSEVESRVQRDIIEANKDAIHHVDVHVRGGRQRVDDDKMIDLRMGLPNEIQAAEETIEQLSRRWKEKYPHLPNGFLGKCTYSNSTGATIGGYVRNIVGIPSVTWEGFSRSDTMNEIENADIINMNVEFLGQYMVNVLKYYQNN